MDRKLMIKILEILEEVYPDNYNIEQLLKELNLKSSNKEFIKVMAYLSSTTNIQGMVSKEMTRLNPFPTDNIYITTEGINFSTKLKKIRTDSKRNNLISDTTIILTQIAIVGIILTILDKFDLPSMNIPWLLSAIMWIVLLTFSLLLFFKIINIIFSKESWKGIFFNRD